MGKEVIYPELSNVFEFIICFFTGFHERATIFPKDRSHEEISLDDDTKKLFKSIGRLLGSFLENFDLFG